MEQIKDLVKNLTMADNAYKAPGRIGNPDLDVQSDPRTRPDLVKVMQSYGIGGNAASEAVDLDDMAMLERVVRASNDGFEGLFEALPNDLPEDAEEPAVEEKDITIDGPDGNKIKLRIYRTDDTSEARPAVCFIHGGGMTILGTFIKGHCRWVKSLALQGLVGIQIDFRNAWQADGKHHPFPAGLNDCAAAVKYVNVHRSELGISKIILQGESGGGNLCLATALKANQEGWVSAIDGVYADVPYISAAYGWPDDRKLKELPSLKENDGYFLDVRSMASLAKYYTPEEGGLEDPLAWPHHASVDALRGLPPHLLHMNELDPLRDEGVAYARKLLAAGVKATAEVELGVTHATAQIFRQALPDVHRKAVRHIAAFAKLV